MSGDPNSGRSGLQTAYDAARAAKAAVRIARAAAASGPQGAAVAAAKEALPLLVKLAIGLVVAAVIVPMMVFTAIPNIFFGYENSFTPPVVEMTQLAAQLGGAYISIEDFERTQMDSIVTSLVSDYENAGTAIDEIQIKSSFSEEDLCWIIAINSAAHQQDLKTMTAADIQSLSMASLTYSPTLGDITQGEGTGVKTVLVVDFGKLDPEKLMQRLGFDDEASTWAGAMFETLSESGALEQYAAYFEKYKIDYNGDSSYTGEALPGGSADNVIDLSRFTDPSTKNNVDLAIYAEQAWEHGWGYVWGTYGNVLTESLLEYKIEQYQDGVGNHEDFIREHWLGRRTTDCVGLIKGYGWLNPETMSISYGTNGMPDYGADQMYRSASESGSMEAMPDIVGLAVWKSGHIGVYIGNGYVIEAMKTSKGVVKTELEGRGWSGWCKIPYINYLDE